MMRQEQFSSEKETIAQLVLDHVLDGIITINQKGIVETMNPAAVQLFGYAKEEVIGNNVSMLMPEPYHSEHDQYLDNYMKTGRAKIIGIGREVVGKKKDGTIFPINLAVTQFEIDGNTHFIGIVQDITERKKTEEALRKALKDDFQHTVKNLQALVFKFMRNSKGEYIFTLFEGRLAISLGFNSHEMVGHRLEDVFPKDKSQFYKGKFSEAYEGHHVNYEMIHDDKVLHITLSPIIENGEVLEVVGSGIEITYRKRMEEELALARDQALESAQIKSQFLANMSHEIRTPMNGIVGVSELLLESNFSKDQADWVTIIHDSAHALLTIINDILDFSKMEAGKMRIDQIRFDLMSLVEGIAEMFVPKARQKGLNLLTFVDPKIPQFLKGDPHRVRQILTNLTDNAIKFTKEGHVIVRVNLLDMEPGRVVLNFTVSDSGIGIKKAEQTDLFQPFVQADGTPTRKYGGTGLGLAISKRLVELMDGEMGLESERGEGTTFWFNVPFETSKDSFSKVKDMTLSALNSRHVLLVIDQPVARDILIAYLESWGCDVTSYDNGIDALSQLKKTVAMKSPIPLAIVGLKESAIDSLTFAEIVHKDPDLAKTKLIHLLDFNNDQGEVTQSEFVAELSQPIRQHQLRDCLSLIFDEPNHRPIPEKRKGHSSVKNRHQDSDTDGVELLLVEDHPVNQKVTQYQLKKLGFNVDLADNGRLALEMIRSKAYRLVLMDIQMPEMDGIEATRVIRSEEAPGVHLPIIAITANAMPKDKEHYLKQGIDDYISKPVTLDQLKKTLKRWVSKEETSPSLLTTGTTENEETAIHLAQLEKTFDHDKQAIFDLLTIFRDTIPPMIGQLTEFTIDQHYKEGAEVAHGLKGASAVIEAHLFRDLSAQIEQALKNQDQKTALTLIKELNQAFEEILTQIKSFD